MRYRTAIFRFLCSGALLCCLVVRCNSPSVFGDESTPNKSATKSQRSQQKTSAPKPRTISVRLTIDQEENALRFAKQHHPELAKLLRQLRETSKLQFNRGIREIHLAAVRLERFKEKQPQRFEAELKSWKSDSELRLLSAKWILSPNPKLEKQIKLLFRKREEARIEKMKSERDRLSERLKQLDSQINMGDEEFESAVKSEWDRLAKRAAATRKSRNRRKTESDSKANPKSRTTKEQS